VTPPLDCVLIADDLTGACDAAGPFALRGRRTAVPIAPDGDTAGASVIAISTESRDAGPAAIPALISAAAASLAPAAPRILFKKIDSTLRGHAGLEIAAALEAFTCDAAVVCPAFPGMNRIVEAGSLRVSGAADFAPVEIVPYLRAQGVECCAHARPGAIAQAIASGARIVVLDAASDGDLDRIVAAAVGLHLRILWTGSAGLAAALARTLPAVPWPHPRPAANGPVLFCIGSDHPATLAQQAALVAHRRALVLHPGDAERLAVALGRGQPVVLRIPRGRVSAEGLRASLAGAPVSALALSGGDTASLVCRAFAVERIDLADEIVPGIPCGLLRGGALDGIPAATKSGGFGAPDALMQIADYFTCPNL
jgi:D-threonate/D-erythronate kinase